jgi:hypothetical protein
MCCCVFGFLCLFVCVFVPILVASWITYCVICYLSLFVVFNVNLNIKCIKMGLDYVKQRELRFEI